MNIKKSQRILNIAHFSTKASLLCACLFALTACATKNSPTPEDPYEQFNRKIFAFNRVVDKAILQPIAKGYDFVLPNPVKKGVSNVFSNIDDVPNVGNDLLQANFIQSGSDLFRFVINSTLGIAGIFDVASKFNLPKHHQDFGLTLAAWGNTNSHYIVLPILGPSTLRDTVALPVDYFSDPITYINPDSLHYSLVATKVINKRAQLLPTDKIVDDAFDPYILVRDAYLQKRTSLMNVNRTETNDSIEDIDTTSIENTAAQKNQSANTSASDEQKHTSSPTPDAKTKT